MGGLEVLKLGSARLMQVDNTFKFIDNPVL